MSPGRFRLGFFGGVFRPPFSFRTPFHIFASFFLFLGLSMVLYTSLFFTDVALRFLIRGLARKYPRFRARASGVPRYFFSKNTLIKTKKTCHMCWFFISENDILYLLDGCPGGFRMSVNSPPRDRGGEFCFSSTSI
jgi:hypothetical protein